MYVFELPKYVIPSLQQFNAKELELGGPKYTGIQRDTL